MQKYSIMHYALRITNLIKRSHGVTGKRAALKMQIVTVRIRLRVRGDDGAEYMLTSGVRFCGFESHSPYLSGWRNGIRTALRTQAFRVRIPDRILKIQKISRKELHKWSMMIIIPNRILKNLSGELYRRGSGAVCKTVAFGLGWFDSITPHWQVVQRRRQGSVKPPQQKHREFESHPANCIWLIRLSVRPPGSQPGKVGFDSHMSC